MLLLRLKEYWDRVEAEKAASGTGTTPTLYKLKPIRYIVHLDEHGNPTSRHPVDTADPASKSTQRGTQRLAPDISRNGIKPLLLADHSEYVFGLPAVKTGEAPNLERAANYREAFRELVQQCADATGEPAVRAVATFLADDPAGKLNIPDDPKQFDRRATVTFQVGNVFPIDLPSVRRFWAAQNDPSAAGGSGAGQMQCVICGQRGPVLTRMQSKIKGVRGGQATGTALISADKESFESYGLEASQVAPTCPDCGERFINGINALIADPTSRVYVGDTTFIFWTREEVEYSWGGLLSNPDPQLVGALIQSVRSGKRAPEVDDVAFYATSLSGNGGRVVVRDWIDITVGDAKRNLARWFLRQDVIAWQADERRPYGIFALSSATVRDATKDLSPVTPRTLLRAAIPGAPLPWAMLYQTVRRCRAEQRVTRPQAALVKLVLLSRRGSAEPVREEYMTDLELANTNPAYLCGRLLAVLEEVQRAALPGIKATIVDRFYGTASSAPASVFGRLLRGAQPHLGKLARDRRGAYVALNRRLEEVQAGIARFPRVLTLEEQGLFALGYYHQRAHDRAAATAARAAKTASLQTSFLGEDALDGNPDQENQ